MELLGSLGVLVGIFMIVFLAVKEMNIILAAPLATLFVIAFNQMDPISTLLGTEKLQFMGALGNYVMSYFAVFLLGSILAELMKSSGATVSIADYILSKVGHDNPYRVMVAIFMIAAILTYGGISLFVAMFAIIPLARDLFKKLDISWGLIQTPVWLGIATITMTMLPGTPAIQNVIPIQYLGTSLTAAAIPSILGAIATTIWGLWYMKHVLNRSIAKGETYATHTNEEDVVLEDRKLPSFAASIMPLAVLVTIAIVGSVFGDAFWKTNVIYFALITGILLAILFFRSYIPNVMQALSVGAQGSIGPLFSTSSAVAFGAVVMAAPGFVVFSELLLGIPGGPEVQLTVLTAAMSGITGSTSGALGIVLPTYGQHFVDAGMHPEMVHRIASVAANILTDVPHGGAVITFLTLTKLNYKNGFKDLFTVVTVGAIISVIVIIASGAIFY